MNRKTVFWGFCAAMAVVLLWAPGAEVGASSWCEDCWQGDSLFGPSSISLQDAGCCIAGTNCRYEHQDGWYPRSVNKEYCHIISRTDGGYQCASGVPQCTSSGGNNGSGGGGGGGFGGGGGGCTISMGALCPASCFSCTRDPFLF